MEEKFMLRAIELAKLAYKKGDVPIGAVIVKDGKIIAEGYNKREKKQNALYHAEVLAINKACKKLKSFRLENCDIYITLEPCPMCCGAIINARIENIFFGAYDKDYGAAGGHYDFPNDKLFGHHPKVVGGIMEEECSKMVKDFFKELRKRKTKNNWQKHLMF